MIGTSDKPSSSSECRTCPAVEAPDAGATPAWRTRVWLALILAVAAALRIIGLGWGLPDIDVRPDEELMVTMALRFGSGDLNPHWFWYPTLEGYLLFACYIVLALVWKLTGVISAPSDMLTRYATDPSAFFLIVRSVSVLSGLVTVWAVYALGRRVYGTAVGLTAAFILAVAFLPVRDSHFGTVDPPMVALAMLAMLPTWTIYERPSRRAYLAAGILVGLAASTKYYGVIAAVAIVAAHLLRPRAPGEPARHGDLVLAGLACIGAFVAASPYVVLGFPEFARDIDNLRRLQAGMSDDHLMRAWKVHLLYTFPRGLTWPIFLASVAGLAGLLMVDGRRALALYAYPLVFFAVIGASWMGFARYVTPIVPFLALTAGWFVVRVATAVAGACGGGLRAAGRLGAVLAVGLCVPSLVDVGYLLHHLRAPDTRRQAALWIRENLPDGGSVGWLGSIYGRPPLPQTVGSLERRLTVALNMGGAGLLSRKRIELARATPPPRYLLIDLPRDPGRWTEAPPDYLILERYPMFYATKEVAFADRWLRLGGYREVRRWTVTDRPGPLPYSDPQDAVYLPFGDLRRVDRSGPVLVLYRRDGGGGPAPAADRLATGPEGRHP